MNTELSPEITRTCSKRHGKIANNNRFTDLAELLDMTEITSGSNVQSTKSTCYRNLTWQNKAWKYSTKCIRQKSLTDHKPKTTRRYDDNHVNITRSNKHGKSAKDNRFTDSVKLLDMPETASGSNV